MSDGIVAVAAIIGAVLTIWKGVIPAALWLRRIARKSGRALDVVLGAPEIPDPDRPGEVLRPGTDDIGVRMTRTEELLQQVVLGAVDEAKQSAKSSAESARAAVAASEAALAIVRKVEHLPEQVARLAKTVEQWQTVDRTRAEVGSAVITELARDASSS